MNNPSDLLSSHQIFTGELSGLLTAGQGSILRGRVFIRTANLANEGIWFQGPGALFASLDSLGKVDGMEKHYLDGPRLREWLLAHPDYSPSQLSAGDARKMGRWKNGDNCDFYMADRMFTNLGIHEWEIPDELWIQKRRSASKWSHLRDEGERLLEMGLSLRFVSQNLGVPRSTVSNWKRDLKLAGRIDGQ